MEIGAAVWVRDKEGDEAWVPGTIMEKSSGKPCKVKIEVDEDFSEEPLTFTLDEQGGYELEDLKLANDEDMDYVEDLISLPHLHEAAILHTLCKRFDRGEIYTFTANAILLAVNPFKMLPLYGKDLLTEYYNLGYMRQQGIESNSKLGPHVFAIADSAYRDMMRGIHGGKAASGTGPVNQAILISGESGAGKTESTKFVMRYLTTVGNGEEGLELEKGSIMDRVLQSNPILESFGNARTIRNDNSSRFGKFIELMFDKRGNLLGASIETYLLEKVRLPTQSSNERNFHVFYQMCKGGSEEEKERWELEGPEDYHFVNQGDCFDLRKVEDEDEFLKTKDALYTMGFEEELVQTIFDITAGMIHLGELEFESNAEDEAAVLSDDDEVRECMERVCRLCYLPQDGLLRALTSKTIEVGPRREKTTIKLKDHQAYDARDALAKAFYGQLFNWLVGRINTYIRCEKKEVKAFIGVLDIFGFECFEDNSFEQLCINYTNETLQQQFNQFVFKMEQKEYTKEGIKWSFVEFPDNQDCLDLIEGKQKGLLTMLDDECRMGIRGTDANYASRLYKEHEESSRFEADSALRTKLCFAVTHYAGRVEYCVETFCDKNRDELPKESDELFASSSNPFVVHLFVPPGTKKAKTKGKKPAPKKDTSQAGIAGLKPTVGTQFKEQLHNLMNMIRETRPHYIRCIKPNDSAEPDEVERVRVMEQLRYGGVLEAVRVARSGYPVRLPHKDFYSRYRSLVVLNPHVKKSKYPVHIRDKSATSANKMCQDLVKSVLLPAIEGKGIPDNTMQFGKAKVFLRKNAHDFLEMLRSRRITEAAITLQRMIRGFVYRRVYFTTRDAIMLIQRMSRGMMARKRVNHMRRMRAALWIQTSFRRHDSRRKYLSLKGAALALQCAVRLRIAVGVHRELKRNHRATKIQSWQRMLGPWKAYRMLLSATLALQCRLRQRIAYGVLRELRMKAKDVGNLKEENERLKQQILELRESAAKGAAEAGNEQLSVAMRENDELRSKVEELNARVTELEGQVKEGEAARAKAEREAESARKKAEEATAAAEAATAADESDALRAKVEELEAALEKEKDVAAAAAAEAASAKEAANAAAAAEAAASAAAASARAVSAPAPAPAPAPVVLAPDNTELESLRATVSELEAALSKEQVKSHELEEKARELAKAGAAMEPVAAPVSSSPENRLSSEKEASLLARIAVLEAEVERGMEKSSPPAVGDPPIANGSAEAEALRERVAELEAALAAEQAAASAKADVGEDDNEGDDEEDDDGGKERSEREEELLARVAELEVELQAERRKEKDRVVVPASNAGQGEALRTKVAELEAELEAEKKKPRQLPTVGTAAAAQAEASMADEELEAEATALRACVMELEASLSRERQERERAVVERDRAEELATRMRKSLKNHVSGSSEEGVDAEASEEAAVEAVGAGGGVDGRGTHIENGDKDAGKRSSGLNTEDVMIHNLSQALDDERQARRSAEEENARLQAEADAAMDAERAQAKAMKTLAAELEEARKAKLKAEQAAASAAASAAALVASSWQPTSPKPTREWSLPLPPPPSKFPEETSGRPRAHLEGNALRTPGGSSTSWRGALHGTLEAGNAALNGHTSFDGSNPTSPGSTVSLGLQGPQNNRGGSTQLHTNAVLEFEERLEAIKIGLAQGVDVIVWEGKTRQAEAVMSASETEGGGTKLFFAAKGTYLIWRAPVRPIPLDSHLKVGLGHGDLHGLANSDDSTFLHMRLGGQIPEEARMVIIQVTDKETRNDLVSGLRRLLTQATVGAMAAEMRGTSASRPGISRRVSVFDLGGGNRGAPSSPPHKGRGLTSAASFSGGIGPVPPSIGGMERGMSLGGGTLPPLSSSSPSAPSRGAETSGRSPVSVGHGSLPTPPVPKKQQEDPEMLELLRNQLEQLAMAKEAELNAKEVELQEARLSSERTMVQMMELTNEVNMKQDEIRMLKRQAQEAVEDMEEMRRTHKDNANVSMQLLKKMESLQFDNEEMRHETEVLRNQVAVFYNEARMAREGRGDMRHETPPSLPMSLSSRDEGLPASPAGSMSSFASCPSNGGREV